MINYFYKKDIRMLFLCDRKDITCCKNELYCSSGFCSHTTDIRNALNRKEFEKDPIKFLSDRCMVHIAEDKIIFFEEE